MARRSAGANQVRRCRICSCTDLQACEGGCWWIESDLCSSCDVRALSILQPFAWLIANGHKDIENRCWNTKFRGQVLIHAGKRWGREQREDLDQVRAQFPRLQVPDVFDLGGIVGKATIVDCVENSDSPWFVGKFGFVMANATPLPFLPLRGMLGFFRPGVSDAW